MFWDYVLPLMEEKGFSQNQLSKEIGKGKTQVNTWVTRGTIPPVDCALNIAKVLGVRIEYFFPELFPDSYKMSDLRRKFHNWVDDMTEDEMEAILQLFKVMGSYGEKLEG